MHMNFFVIVFALKKVTPHILKLHCGEQGEFICRSEGNVYWLLNGRRIKGRFYKRRVLLIDDIKHKDAGVYTCLGSYNKGLNRFLSGAYLKVYGKGVKCTC